MVYHVLLYMSLVKEGCLDASNSYFLSAPLFFLMFESFHCSFFTFPSIGLICPCSPSCTILGAIFHEHHFLLDWPLIKMAFPLDWPLITLESVSWKFVLKINLFFPSPFFS